MAGGHPVPNGGAVAGPKHPVPVMRANGTADRVPGNGGRAVLPADGVPIRDWASLPIGFGVRAAEPLIIRSRIGEPDRGLGQPVIESGECEREELAQNGGGPTISQPCRRRISLASVSLIDPSGRSSRSSKNPPALAGV